MLKQFEYSDLGRSKVRAGASSMSVECIADSVRSTIPGEWIYLIDADTKYLAMINQFSKDPFHVRIVSRRSVAFNSLSVEEYISNSIKRAFEFRRNYNFLKVSSRIVYGEEDELPGLIVDMYSNCVLYQVSHYGMYLYKNHIAKTIEKLTGLPTYYIEKNAVREIEGFPNCDVLPLPENIEVEENGFFFNIPSSVFQKNGYYFDHRDNRRKMEYILSSYNQTLIKGLDLFCYSGSWGHYLLRSGVETVDFVDQGNFSDVVYENLKNNKFENRGTFVRSDVFEFLKTGKSGYDVIVCDPPAFAKSKEKKNSAILGYRKLYSSILNIINNNGFLIAASCTKEVTLEDLDRLIQDELRAKKISATLIDYGGQSIDHPYSNFKSRANYIKYIMYQIRK